MTVEQFVRAVREIEAAMLVDLARRIGLRLRGITVAPDDEGVRRYLRLLPALRALLVQAQQDAFATAQRVSDGLPGGPGLLLPAPAIPDLDPIQDLRDGALRVLRAQDDVFRAAVEASLDEGNATTRLEKSRRAFAQLTRAGVPGFTDRAGRRWAMGTYTEMATRTATGRAEVAGRLTGYAAAGRDLVIVSDAPEECVMCRPFEGRVFSLSGTSQEYPALTTALAGGLHHPNCRHDERPYLPGITKRYGPTADPEGDKIRQRQRALERRVRAAKVDLAISTEMAAGAGLPTPSGPRERLRDAQAALRAFNTEHNRKAEVSRRRVSLGAR